MNSINEYIKKYKENQILKKLANYFLKNWENSNFINFNSLDDSKIKYRTNNQVELFHRSLNQLIENSHQKISYLLEKLKLLIVNKYNDYLIYAIKINNEKVNKYDLFEDIYNFTVEFSKKYNINFDFNLLIQVENNLKDELKKMQWGKGMGNVYDLPHFPLGIQKCQNHQ